VSEPGSLPPKVAAALQWTGHCDLIRRPDLYAWNPREAQHTQLDKRELTSSEEAAYNSAVEVLSLYFRNELEFQDPSIVKAKVDAKKDVEVARITAAKEIRVARIGAKSGKEKEDQA